MSHRRFLAAVVGTALAVATAGQSVTVRAHQDATSQVLAERGELDKALAAQSADARITMLEKFLSDHPESLLGEQAREALVRSHASIGEAALKAQDPRAATEAFERAFASAGATIPERLFRNVIWPMPVVMNQAGYRFEAIQLMKSFEPRFESDAGRLVQIGFFYVTIESPTDAVRVLERAVELAPTDHAAYRSLGTAYIISLRLDDAATAFAKAIELDPKEEFAYTALANLKRAFGDPAQAVELYKKELEIKPDDPDSYAGLAVSYLLLDDDASASTALARVLALAPNNFRLYTQIAYYYASRGRYDKAKEMVDLSMRYEPRFAWTHIVAGNVLLGQKEYARAIEVLRSAQQYGDFPTLHFELAKAYMTNDQFNQAVESLAASYDITDDGQFETRLGDVLDARSSQLDLLLERERQAVLGIPIQPTTPTQYRLAESLSRIAHFLGMIPEPSTTPAAAPRVEAPPVETDTTAASTDDSAAPAEAGTGEIAAEAVMPAEPTAEPTVEPTAEPTAGPESSPQSPPPSESEIVFSDTGAPRADAPLVFRPRRVVATAVETAAAAPEVARDETLPAAGTSEPSAEPAADAAGETAPEPVRVSEDGREVAPEIREPLIAAIDTFVGVDDGREAFRRMWVARQLAEKGILLDKAKALAQAALDGVDTAVALEKSVRDLPDADLETRRAVVTARAEDTLGWVLLKRGDRDEARELLRRSVRGATSDPEKVARLWHLGVAEQESGNEREALDLYLQAYDPASPSAPVRKQIIESLYVRIHGSTEGLDQRLTTRP